MKKNINEREGFMKTKVYLIPITTLALLIGSCSKKDSPTDPGTGAAINVNFTLTAGKTFNYQYFELDSLNNKVGTAQAVSEKINSINFSYGGYNDAAQIIVTNPEGADTTYRRVVSGKDIYEWTDTSAGIGMMTIEKLRSIFYKQTSTGMWLPLVLLSKGEGAEYVTQPKRTTTIQIDTISIPISLEMKAKNEGFEDVTTPAGKFRAYKVKTTFKVDIPFETINLNIYTWISDDLDYIVKQEQRSVTSKVFNITLPGFVQELQSTGM